MPVVSNTSPILGLAAVHCLYLLKQQDDLFDLILAQAGEA